MGKEKVDRSGRPTITFRPVVGEPRVRYRDEGLVILGKFCYNLAALVFGGVVLSLVMEYRKEKLHILIGGIVLTLVFVALGWILIKIGLCKIK